MRLPRDSFRCPQCDAAQTELREPPKRLSQASDQLWPRIAEGTYRFEWARSVADAMEEVSLADVVRVRVRVSLP